MNLFNARSVGATPFQGSTAATAASNQDQLVHVATTSSILPPAHSRSSQSKRRPSGHRRAGRSTRPADDYDGYAARATPRWQAPDTTVDLTGKTSGD